MNVVDSCGWLSYLLADGNRDFFEPVLIDREQLLVPGVVIFEVTRRIIQLFSIEQANVVHRAMRSLSVVNLDADGMYAAAISAQHHKLHMADAIIWQTAQSHGAKLYTQDAALKGLPGVVYRSTRGAS